MINRLIFEGPDDKHVVMSLLYNHEHNGSRLDEVFAAKDKGGIDNLVGTLREELGATDLGNLGVVLDADADVSRQWARVSRVLAEYGCNVVPPIPDMNGTIVETNDGKRIGIWVMPDNQNAGAVEDFIAALIAEGDQLWPKAQTDVDAIPTEHRRFRNVHISKARVHTWLAWQEQPGIRMGQTFRIGCLDPQHPRAQAFVNWLKRLLRLEAEAEHRG